jgi:hypothetical protein
MLEFAELPERQCFRGETVADVALHVDERAPLIHSHCAATVRAG